MSASVLRTADTFTSPEEVFGNGDADVEAHRSQGPAPCVIRHCTSPIGMTSNPRLARSGAAVVFSQMEQPGPRWWSFKHKPVLVPTRQCVRRLTKLAMHMPKKVPSSSTLTSSKTPHHLLHSMEIVEYAPECSRPFTQLTINSL